MRRTLCVFIGLVIVLSFFLVPNSHAVVTSYWVTDAYYVGYGYGGNFKNVTTPGVYIDPSETNWVAWHDHTAPDVVGGQAYVGDYGNWLGVDDWFYLTITNPAGVNSSRMQMDWNSSFGTASGTQAVIFGTAADAPNVWRSNLFGAVKNIDEAGLFNSFISGSTAGEYTFKFEFFDGYSGSRGNPNMYLLVDAQDANHIVPEPATMSLLGLGLVGLLTRKKPRAR